MARGGNLMDDVMNAFVLAVVIAVVAITVGFAR